MKHKVSELEGELLDAAVAKADGMEPYFGTFPPNKPKPSSTAMWRGADGWTVDSYSSVWGCGGPIIERERISVSNPNGDPGWIGTIAYPTKPKRNGTPQWGHHWECGPTPLIAAMRAYVSSKFGEEVELP